MNCKYLVILFLIFLLFSFMVISIPIITEYDITVIKYVQNILNWVNPIIPISLGGIVFYIITCLPLVIEGLYFLFNRMYKCIFLYALVPFTAYFLNSIIKIIVSRPRPPLELQIEEHMKSSSYISRHTFVTACVWGIFVYFICKYCKNKFLKYFLIIISFLWIIFEGFSRIWIGVHYPTDVIGALIFSSVFIIFYILLIEGHLKKL